MSIKVTEFNDVKAYNLCAGKTLPGFIEEAIKKNQSNLKQNEDYKRRIELLQDFEFPTSSEKIRLCKDERYIGAIGSYPPEFRLYDTDQLSMKFMRRLDSEIVDFIFLDDDWKKVVFLCSDRTIEFHAQYGKHHKLRTPKVGRCMVYDQARANLLIAGSCSDIFRIDLEEGIFCEPMHSNLEAINAMAINPALPLLVCAGEGGIVETWDLRDPRKPISELQVWDEDDDIEDENDKVHFAKLN